MTALDLAALTRSETDSLWWRLIRAVAAVMDEYEHLASCPPQLASQLYEGATPDQFRAMGQELMDLIADDVQAADVPDPEWDDDPDSGWWITTDGLGRVVDR